ncbi:MAG TPA: multidrug effflux MFS transporter, partial [Burkholderiales bacterium]|nr:multidrug effflux MFS transporter [Burkholderiales bacterium]
AIRADFGISVLQVQQTLSLYLLTFALMMLFHGTLSDSFGRRPVILASLVLFVGTSLGCAAAHRFEQLLLFRALQGLSAGAGMVVGRAIIRDSLEGHAAQRLMALVTLIFGVAPVIAPVVGGWLQQWFGWRSIFVFLAVYGAALLALCYARLPETLPLPRRQPFALLPLARNYVTLGSNVPLLLLCAAVALNFSGFFIYIVSAPAFVYNLLKLGQTQFAWLFLPGITGVMLGAFISGRTAGHLTSRETVQIAYGIMAAAALFNVVYSAAAEPALPWSVLPIMVYTTGMALAMPSLTLLALELFPQNRGMTASLQGFGQHLLAVATAGVLSPLLSHSDITLALGMAVPMALGWGAWMVYVHRYKETHHA